MYHVKYKWAGGLVCVGRVCLGDNKHALAITSSLKAPITSTLGNSDRVINTGIERCFQPSQLSVFYFQFSLRGKVEIIWQFSSSQGNIGDGVGCGKIGRIP